MAACGGLQVINPFCRATQAVGSAAKAVANDAFSAIAHYFASAAEGAIAWLWTQLDAATAVSLTDHGLRTDLAATGAIAGLIAITLFVVQVILSVLRAQPGGLGRAARGLGVAFVGAAFAVAATQASLTASDGLCNGVVELTMGTTLQGLGERLISASALSAITNPAGLLLLALVLTVAVVVIWVALMVRKMLIIVAAVFAPVAFAGAASDLSVSWVRRWIEFTVALVMSKLVLVIMFLIGVSVLDGAGRTSGGASHAAQSVTNLAVGALTLLLAGFAPWLAIRMVHFAGDSFHAMHIQSANATAGARSAASAPGKAAAVTGAFAGAAAVPANAVWQAVAPVAAWRPNRARNTSWRGDGPSAGEAPKPPSDGADPSAGSSR